MVERIDYSILFLFILTSCLIKIKFLYCIIMKKGQSVVIWILAALIVYNIFLNNKIQTNIQEYEDKIDNLQTKVDSVNNLNKELDMKINSLHTQMEIIDSDISNVQTNINVIKRKTNEKINSVDQFTFLELEQFFTARYSDQIRGLDSTAQSTNRPTGY